MIYKYPVITLCGSTRFKDEFIRLEKEITLDGNIVLTCGLFNHADNEQISEETKLMLDDMHKRKIDMSDGIVVVNVDDYIGESTRSEIMYAKSTGKSIRYAFPHNVEDDPTYSNDRLHFHAFKDYCNLVFCGTYSEDLFFDKVIDIIRFYRGLGYVTWQFPDLIFFEYPEQSAIPKMLRTKTLDKYACDLIDIADVLVVVDADGYRGPVLQQAIEYAKSKNKIIEYGLKRYYEGRSRHGNADQDL